MFSTGSRHWFASRFSIIPTLSTGSVSATAFLLAMLAIQTGCVAPMGCGPDASGPFAMNSCGGCGDCSGCGELYVDPWINHPPSGDPCDCCGNFNGQSCGRCRSIFDGISSLWGYRCGNDGSCDSGCDSGCGGSCGPLLPMGSCGPDCCGCDSCGSCDSMGQVYAGGGMDDGVMFADGGMPTMSESVIVNEDTSMPMARSYQPSRTKKIFRPIENMVRANDNQNR